MSGFAYRDGVLHAEQVSLEAIAAAVGTPCYVYAAGAMRAGLAGFRHAFRHRPTLLCYALKANSNLAVVRLLAAEGAGADTVSGGEVRRALAAGVPPRRIVLAGVAKADDEIRLALATGILQLNVESVPELVRIGEIATAMGVTAPVALRVNPDVAAETHDRISTGRREDKFGIDHARAGEAFALARELPGVEPVGLHIHIGSQIGRVASFEPAYARAVAMFRDLRSAGLPLRRLDLGGGFGVRYLDEARPVPGELAALVDRLTDGLDCELILEPGRVLVAEAGVMLARVIYLKETDARRFLVLDAGMNNLIRPMLYGAHHEILPVREPGEAEAGLLAIDVVGPVCESTDVFARDRRLPPLGRGDLVAFTAAGAYGAVMASDYNSRPSAAQVLVDGDRFAVVKPRREAEEQFADERIPEWLGAVPAGPA
ncbi:MAG TPA: diaminopimelate decarboxylase [Geminicoccaceae bacterium]